MVVVKEKILYRKELRLITPEYAQQLDIPAEAPVFVSPYIDKAQICDECRIEYKPLVYQANSIVTAHHFHPKWKSMGS